MKDVGFEMKWMTVVCQVRRFFESFFSECFSGRQGTRFSDSPSLVRFAGGALDRQAISNTKGVI